MGRCVGANGWRAPYWSGGNGTRSDAIVSAVHDYKQWLRRRLETVFGEISKLFPKKIPATTLSGFILKISLFLFAYQVDKAFIQ
jgi:hypothetical protein